MPLNELYSFDTLGLNEPINDGENDGETKNEPINDGETKNEPINDGENDGENKALSDKEHTVLSLINDNPSITTVTLIEKTGFSRPTIERSIKKLKIQKYIVRIGGDKGGHWKIIKHKDSL